MAEPGASYPLHCAVHLGPLKYRPAEHRWVCPGFDGENPLCLPDGIPEEAYARVSAAETRWPGLIRKVSY